MILSSHDSILSKEVSTTFLPLAAKTEYDGFDHSLSRSMVFSENRTSSVVPSIIFMANSSHILPRLFTNLSTSKVSLHIHISEPEMWPSHPYRHSLLGVALAAYSSMENQVVPGTVH